MESKNYLIKVKNLESNPSSVFIANIVLNGEKKDLYEKLTDVDYVKSLNIHESFIGKEIELVQENSIAFPE